MVGRARVHHSRGFRVPLPLRQGRNPMTVLAATGQGYILPCISTSHRLHQASYYNRGVVGVSSAAGLWGAVMLGALLGPELHEMIRDKNWDELRDVISGWDPSDIASILIEIPDEDDVAIFRLLPRDVAGRVFAYLPRDHQENLLRSLTNDQARTVLKGMTPDDQARLLEELPAEVTRRVLATLAPAELQAARDLLGYPPATAGRYMTPRYVDLDPNFTAQQALDYVRRIGTGMETLGI